MRKSTRAMPVPVALMIHPTEPLSTAPFAIELDSVTVDVTGAGAGAGAGATTAVGSEVAVPCCFAGIAVTRSLEPTSVDVRRYFCAVAPPIETHELPFTSQRLHWYVNVV